MWHLALGKRENARRPQAHRACRRARLERWSVAAERRDDAGSKPHRRIRERATYACPASKHDASSTSSEAIVIPCDLWIETADSNAR